MSEEREYVKRANVTLLPSQWATVDAFAKERSDLNRSAALRRIINEWVMLTGRQIAPTNGEIQEAQ